MSWNPDQYLKFAGPRLRPGIELISRIPDLDARSVVDLGCGTGELTALLAKRWQKAKVSGVDRSAAMLAKAATADTSIARVEADIAAWASAAGDRGERFDLIYSNAALHWLEDHPTLFRQLGTLLDAGGVLAVQMPRNFDQPSHRILHETVAAHAPVVDLRRSPVASPVDYFDLLGPVMADVDIWETEYLHVLDGPDPVFEWTKGTAMVPVREVLEGETLAAVETEYRARLAEAYPKRADGHTLFPFRRIFIVARRAG